MRSATLLSALALFTALKTSAAPLHEIPLQDIDARATTLAPYQGKVLLIVNVASQCGNTPQYTALEALYQKHKDAGFVVLGFPCNQFGGQEPGTNEQIKDFCSLEYKVTFPMFSKIEVNGENRHPLYTELAGDASQFPGKIEWNFAKFLVGRDGKVLARFPAKMSPNDPAIISAIEAALAAK
jgi:glutathione peroxidase